MGSHCPQKTCQWNYPMSLKHLWEADSFAKTTLLFLLCVITYLHLMNQIRCFSQIGQQLRSPDGSVKSHDCEMCLLLTNVLKPYEGKKKEKENFNNSVGKYQCKSDLILQGILVIKTEMSVSEWHQSFFFWPGHWGFMLFREWGIWKVDRKIVTESSSLWGNPGEILCFGKSYHTK